MNSIVKVSSGSPAPFYGCCGTGLWLCNTWSTLIDVRCAAPLETTCSHSNDTFACVFPFVAGTHRLGHLAGSGSNFPSATSTPRYLHGALPSSVSELAAEELRSDREIVLVAAKQNAIAPKYAAPELRKALRTEYNMFYE